MWLECLEAVVKDLRLDCREDVLVQLYRSVAAFPLFYPVQLYLLSSSDVIPAHEVWLCPFDLRSTSSSSIWRRL